ncbi:MAG: cytochrome P460 family protein [Pseudomonadota bacterium]
MKQRLLLCILACLLSTGALAGDEERVDMAKFDAKGNLITPDDLDQWVFIGSSLGMGYSQENFDPDSPGMFQIVRMEPNAYRAFQKSGKFIDGTMLSLHFYGSQNEISIARAGFTMEGLHFAEIHYKDSQRFPDGFNFYNLENEAKKATEIPIPNECIECHKRDGAYDSVFVQFYPTIHEYLPEPVMEKLNAMKVAKHH